MRSSKDSACWLLSTIEEFERIPTGRRSMYLPALLSTIEEFEQTSVEWLKDDGQ